MRRQLERYGKWLIAIAFLAVVSLVCGVYIVIQQHISNPFEDKRTVYAEIRTTNGLIPGLAQPVNVAGVRVGTIADAELKNGISRVKLEIKEDELDHVYNDARATLVPNTALKDMQIELVPGTREAGEMPDGGTIPVARTAPPVDADELTAALDADSREFFTLLVSGTDRGLRGRGQDLNELLKALEPTAKQMQGVTGVLADRHKQLKRLVTNLGVLSRAVGKREPQLVRLIDQSNTTLGALAAEQSALGQSVARLPGTLAKAQSSLRNATGFANQLGPTLTALRPAVRKLPATLRDADPLLREGEPILRTKMRPFVREIQPLAQNLAPTTADLSKATPSLLRAFDTLNYVANELGYNPPGDDEGYLFWLAWLAHNGASILSTEDANGATIRGLGLVSCDTFNELPAPIGTLFETLTGPINAC